MSIIRVPIPEWAFDTTLRICIEREQNFRNQFVTKKLRSLVSDNPILARNVEGVIGYIGDICACVWLGMDPKEHLRQMLISTDLLAHRDDYDVLYRGWRIDVKTELVPDNAFQAVVSRSIMPEVRYGCRLINGTQFRENSHSVDIYLFGLLDQWDPRSAKFWYPVGAIAHKEIVSLCPQPLDYVGPRRLHTPAHVIPTQYLRPPEDLLSIKERSVGSMHKVEFSTLPEAVLHKYRQLCTKVGL